MNREREDSRSRRARRAPLRVARRSSPSTTRGSASRRPPSCARSCASPTPRSRSSRTGSPSSPPSKAGTEIDELLTGPIALTLINGDPVVVAKTITNFTQGARGARVQGRADGRRARSTSTSFSAIARLPGLDVLHGQLVGLTASPLTGLVAGMSNLISGLGRQLAQIAEQGLVTGEAPASPRPRSRSRPRPRSPPRTRRPVEEPPAGGARRPSREAEAAAEEPETETEAESPEEVEAEGETSEEPRAGGISGNQHRKTGSKS